MGTILYIGNTYCTSYNQLRDYILLAADPNNPIREELLTLLQDGLLYKWLAEGSTNEERNAAEKIRNLSSKLTNSEKISQLGQIFATPNKEVAKPKLLSLVELKSVRYLSDKSNSLITTDTILVDTSEKDTKVQLSFIVNKSENEKFSLIWKDNDIENSPISIHLGKYKKGDKFLVEMSIPRTDNHQLSLFSAGELIYSCKVVKKCKINNYKIGSVDFNMIFVEGGTFKMGAVTSNPCSDEEPKHNVTLSSYYIGEVPVTQELWQCVMNNNPSIFKNPIAPVENVSWQQCKEFIKILISLTGISFRLPTEAEWEYAARGGCHSRNFVFSGSNDVKDVAWCVDNSNDCTHPVKQKKCNELGLYDMSGNVWEWCQDYYGKYSLEDAVNPMGPDSGSNRVQRGGCWDLNGFTGANSCRVSYRSSNSETYSSKRIGFRLALSVD